MLNTPFPNLHNKLPAMLCTLTLFTLAVVLCFKPTLRNQTASSTSGPFSSALLRLPLYFVPNYGQTDTEVLYTVRTPGMAAYFTRREVVYVCPGTHFRAELIEANPSPAVEALDASGVKVNFLVGNRPEQWRIGERVYRRIVYREVYPGIDLFYSGGGGQLKSEFSLVANADPRRIRLRYTGVTDLRIDSDGALVFTTSAGQIRERRPYAYQEREGEIVSVACRFRLYSEDQVGFDVGVYDSTKPLVIDPVLSFSTWLGGSGMDSARAVSADAAGNVYIAGYTDSLDFPTKGAIQGSSGGGVDAFVAKLNPSGSTLIYCTYLGGSWDDRATGIAVDSTGNVYIAGQTSSPNFPVTSNALQRTLGGGRDAFVAKLNPGGNALLYSTFLGGSNHDSASGMALDSFGNAYVVGSTYSLNFPVLNAIQSTNQGRQDVFVAKLKTDGSALIWSTYLGGAGDDLGTAIAVDSAGNAYITGATDSSNFPVANAFQRISGGGQDAFVAKLSSTGGALIYSTYLGGSGGTVGANEMGTGIAVDASASAYITGITSSTNFPVVNAIQPSFAGGAIDGFVTKLNPDGLTLAYSTYLGGVGADFPNGIAVDLAGAATLTGYTSSVNFPIVNALQSINAGGYDGFITKLNAQGNAVVESTYFGGNGSDSANAIFVLPNGLTLITGDTQSTNFPVKNPLSSTAPGGMNAFVLKLGAVIPTTVYRASDGSTILNIYGSTARYNGTGVLVSELGASQNAQGDTFVVGRNSSNQVWMNCFRNDTQTWRGWVLAGGVTAGNPAIAASEAGEAFVVARNASFEYWLNYYRPSTGFQGWIFLGRGFTTDPVVACANGKAYVAGIAASGAVWLGRYTPGSGFEGWVSGGGASSGKPALTVGSDGGIYVAVKGTDGALWLARVTGTSWGPWKYGGGTLGSDPDLASVNGTIYAAVTGPTGLVYVRPYLEAIGWQNWIATNGTLSRVSIASAGDRFCLVGRNQSGELWWYQSGGTGWSYYGTIGQASSNPVAAPK